MRPDISEPEIIPPSKPNGRENSGLSDEALSRLATLLDDLFRIPGTSFRFGLDPLIGLIPGIGDLVTGAASFLIIFTAWQRQLPRVTVARMVANVVLDTLVGSVPVAGDLFDAAWKSNRKNMVLLQRSSLPAARRQSWKDWLFLGALVLAVACAIAIPIALLTLAFHALWERR
jgi:hypothetical protein